MAKFISSQFKKLFSWQFVRYIIVGFIGTFLDFSILYILVEYGHLFYLISAIISVSIVVWLSFSLNKYWTFRNFQKGYLIQFGKYIVAHLIALVLSLIILTVLVEIFGLWYIFAKFFATVVAAITNFLLTKRYIFFEE